MASLRIGQLLVLAILYASTLVDPTSTCNPPIFTVPPQLDTVLNFTDCNRTISGRHNWTLTWINSYAMLPDLENVHAEAWLPLIWDLPHCTKFNVHYTIERYEQFAYTANVTISTEFKETKILLTLKVLPPDYYISAEIPDVCTLDHRNCFPTLDWYFEMAFDRAIHVKRRRDGNVVALLEKGVDLVIPKVLVSRIPSCDSLGALKKKLLKCCYGGMGFLNGSYIARNWEAWFEKYASVVYLLLGVGLVIIAVLVKVNV